MQQGRQRPIAIALIVVSLLSGLLVLLGTGPSAEAKPRMEKVKERVDRLNRKAEAASERYNDARVKRQQAQVKLAALNADLQRQSHLVELLRRQVAAIVVEQMQGATLSTTSQLVLSDDPDAFLNNLNTVTAYNTQRSQVMDQFGIELDRLRLRKSAVKEEAARLAAIQQTMATEKAEIAKQASAAQDLLDQLQARQRAAVTAPAWTGPIPKVPPAVSGRAADAVRFALAQVGKSYAYGATGPGAYDCSGLTMAAWAAAGVALPHSSRAQMSSGTPISESQLKPGDLVFYYSPVSHVGIYIGRGLIVNAQNPSTGVRVNSLHSMPYVGAVRPG